MYTLETACRVMNTLGRERRAFAFAIPYETEDCPVYVESCDEPGCLYYSMPGAERLPRERPSLPVSPVWQPQPPAFAQYRRAFDCVQEHLRRGNSYLVNLCFATPVRSNLSLEQVFAHARAPYKLLVPGRFTCFSPEPFVEMSEGKIRTFPMKGTVRCRADVPRLLADVKEQREHATVVDLLRNDLACVGSRVEVERYRYVERIAAQGGELYATSSAIAAQLPLDWQCRVGDLLARLLPAGSVTGAPKAWTCRAIAEAELVSRGYYTGIFGHFDGSRLRSAVSIRFVEEKGAGVFLYRSGGGITVLSRAEDEWRELCDKVYLPFPLTQA